MSSLFSIIQNEKGTHMKSTTKEEFKNQLEEHIKNSIKGDKKICTISNKYVSPIALLKGDLEKVKEEINLGKTIRKDHYDAFCSKITEKNKNVLFFLLSQKILPQHIDMLVKYGDMSIIEKIIESGGTFTSEGMDIAFYYGFEPIVLKLWNVFNLKPRKGMNFACGKGHLSLVKFAIETMEFLPNVYDVNEACGKGHLELVSYLFDKGVKPNMFGANYACSEGRENVVRFLIKRDILPNRYSLDLANKYPRILEMLRNIKLE